MQAPNLQAEDIKMKARKRMLIDELRGGGQRLFMVGDALRIRPVLLLVLAVLINIVGTGCNSDSNPKPQSNTFSGSVLAPSGANAWLQKTTWAKTALALSLGEVWLPANRKRMSDVAVV